MKKLLALLTAPLTMTACIDLSNVENANVGTDGEVNNPGETMTGFAALRSAYFDTEFVSEFDDSKTGDSLASVAVMNTCDIDSLKGRFNTVASLTKTASEIMTTRDGELDVSEDNRDATARYIDETPFYKDDYTSLGGHKYAATGYIDYRITENDTVDMQSHEWTETKWNGVVSQTMIRVSEGITQMWTKGNLKDVMQLTPAIYAYRELNDQGNKELNVFNINTGAMFVESTINSSNCNIGTGLDEFIAEAKAVNWINSDINYDGTLSNEFDNPTYAHSVDDIRTKLGIN